MVDQSRLWDEHAAATYDTPGQGPFAPEVLGPTVELLAGLAAWRRRRAGEHTGAGAA